MAGLFVLLAWLLLAGVVGQALRLAASWRRGGPAPVNWARGLAALPRRYLVDVHGVVALRAAAARMHQAIAGGLLGGTALVLLGILPALRGAEMLWLLAAYAAGGFLASLGILLGLWLPALAGIGLAAWGGARLVVGIATGPMRHALAGAVHLAAHPRPERFAGATASGLLPAQKFGVATISDFAWNRLAGFDACIQCGRCEEACPAFAAGQKLNPKALIQDLATALHPDAPSYAGSPHPGMSSPGPVLGRLHAETLFACTTCRACVSACPMMIEHVDAVID
ncbi:MAG: (Fe-S)-binding protein, partial [Acidiphilium sp. 21-66-27]